MAAASDLTLASTVATELGVSAGDERLPRLIAVASAAVLRYCNRRQFHYEAAYVESLAGHGRPRLVLGLTPVVEITSITFDGSAVDATAYDLEDAEAGLLFRAGGWPWTGRFRGGLPPQTDRDAGSEEALIEVTYAGGYVTPAQEQSAGWDGPARSLPYDLEEAVVQTIVQLYRRGGTQGDIASESLGDYSVSYRGVSAGGFIPDPVLPILDRYRRLL